MKTNRIISHCGLTLNLADVKCFHLSNFSSIGKRNTMTVEFYTRFDYIKHPETGEFEKQEYNESTALEFPDYETAKIYRDEWVAFWEEYLEEQVKLAL